MLMRTPRACSFRSQHTPGTDIGNVWVLTYRAVAGQTPLFTIDA